MAGQGAKQFRSHLQFIDSTASQWRTFSCLLLESFGNKPLLKVVKNVNGDRKYPNRESFQNPCEDIAVSIKFTGNALACEDQGKVQFLHARWWL